MLVRFDKMSISRAIDANDDLSWCPTPGCPYAFLKDESKFDCPICYKSYCLDCRVDFHIGKTCIEIKAERVN
jgi:ariadne-1